MSQRTVFSTARVLITLGCVTALAGCPPCGGSFHTPTDPQWHFEQDCADSVCGFAVTSGTAERVTALTEGEHALRIDADSTIEHALSTAIMADTLTRIELAARCDTGTTLTVTLTVDSMYAPDAATPGSTATEAFQWPANLTTTSNWSNVTASLTPTSTTSPTGTATKLQFAVSGTGSCTIDDIYLVAHTYVGYCE